MPAGNPQFVKGNQLAKGGKGGGRKGYEYEERQLRVMNKTLDWALKIITRIRLGTAEKEEIERFQLLEKSLHKILDKMHANKQETTMDFKKPILIKGDNDQDKEAEN